MSESVGNILNRASAHKRKIPVKLKVHPDEPPNKRPRTQIDEMNIRPEALVVEPDANYLNSGDAEDNYDDCVLIEPILPTLMKIKEEILEVMDQSEAEPRRPEWDTRLQVPTNCIVAAEDLVNLSNFDKVCILGTGETGNVFLVRKRGGHDHRQVYAMKEINKPRNGKGNIQHMISERMVLETIEQRPFLMSLHYAFQTATKVYLVLDYITGGELYTHLHKVLCFEERDVRIYIAEVVLAMEQLHKLNIVYRDIKLENILLDSHGHIIVTDFSVSRFMEVESNELSQSYCGTAEYMAPEVIIRDPGHNSAADWWSVGVLTFELLTGRSPFIAEDLVGVARQQEIFRLILNEQPMIPPYFDDTVKDFILCLMNKNQAERLGGNRKSARDIKNHAFFADINWDDVWNKRLKASYQPRIEREDDTQNFSIAFTSRPIEIEAEPVQDDYDWHILGYEYVAPQHMRKQSIIDTYHNEFCAEPIIDPPCMPGNLETWEALYSGSFGHCYMAMERGLQRIYLLKVMPAVLYRPQEVDALLALGRKNHKGICQYYGTYRDLSGNISIQMELLCGGSLARHIATQKNGLSEPQCRDIFAKICDAVHYIHSKNFIHGDLKPDNIVFADHDMKYPKIIDFGASSYNSTAEHWIDAPRYTLEYAPPEALENADYAMYSRALDVWYLGATLYAMYMMHTPFRHGKGENCVSNAVLKNRILNDNLYTASMRYRVCSGLMKQLLHACLEKLPKQRPSVADILKHPWLAAVNSVHHVPKRSLTPTTSPIQSKPNTRSSKNFSVPRPMNADEEPSRIEPMPATTSNAMLPPAEPAPAPCTAATISTNFKSVTQAPLAGGSGTTGGSKYRRQKSPKMCMCTRYTLRNRKIACRCFEERISPNKSRTKGTALLNRTAPCTTNAPNKQNIRGAKPKPNFKRKLSQV